MSKIFTIIISLCLVTQIIFSFFYSSQILTQNSQLNQTQSDLNQISLEIEKFQKQVSDLLSINHLNLSTPSASYKFINQSLTINP
jgi:peptidoglycan hydrolase CwlO-like protein